MRGKSLVLSGLLLVASGQSWGCKVSVGDDDSSFEEEEEGDAGTRDGGSAGKPAKPPKGGSGSAGTSADGGVAGNSSQAGRGGAGAGSSGNAGTGSSTPVPGGTMLSDLDQGDAMAVCDQFASEIGKIVTDEQVAKVNCTLDALFISLTPDPETDEYIVDVAACEDEAADCIEQGLGEGTTECDVTELLAMTATCDATVTEYLACQRGLAEQYSDAFDSFSCAAFADPMVAENAVFAVDPEEVPACVTLIGKCPELGADE